MNRNNNNALGWCALMIVAAGLSVAQPGMASGETWTDATGKYRVEATFVSVNGNSVTLKKPDGQIIAVPLSKLNAASRAMASRLAAARTPMPAVDRNDPVAYVEWLFKRTFENGDVGVWWELLPANQQKDINDIVHQAARMMDAKMWNSIVGIIRKSGTLLDKQQSFIAVAITKQAEIPVPQVGEVLKPASAGLGKFLTEFANSDLLNLEVLKTADFRNVVNSTIAKLQAVWKEQSAIVAKKMGIPLTIPKLTAKVELVSRDGATATIRWTPVVDGVKPPGAQTTEFAIIQVEGKWYFKDMLSAQSQWKQAVPEIKNLINGRMRQELQKVAPQVAQVSQIANLTLDGMLQASNQAEFDKAALPVVELVKEGVGAAGAAAGGGFDPFGK